MPAKKAKGFKEREKKRNSGVFGSKIKSKKA